MFGGKGRRGDKGRSIRKNVEVGGALVDRRRPTATTRREHLNPQFRTTQSGALATAYNTTYT